MIRWKPYILVAVLVGCGSNSSFRPSPNAEPPVITNEPTHPVVYSPAPSTSPTPVPNDPEENTEPEIEEAPAPSPSSDPLPTPAPLRCWLQGYRQIYCGGGNIPEASVKLDLMANFRDIANEVCNSAEARRLTDPCEAYAIRTYENGYWGTPGEVCIEARVWKPGMSKSTTVFRKCGTEVVPGFPRGTRVLR